MSRVDLAAHQAAIDAMPGRARTAPPVPDCVCALTGATCHPTRLEIRWTS